MDPQQEYAARRDGWRIEQEALHRQFISIGNWRLVLGIMEAVLACLVFGLHAVTPWLLLVPLIPFILLVIRHQGVRRRQTRAARALRYYEQRLARFDDTWIGRGSAGEQFHNPEHVYAEDLDVFGKGSLFELISSARTLAGEQLLAQWLLSPADRDHAIPRQQAVQELRTRLDLREDLALLGEEARADLNVDAVSRWGSAPEVQFARGLRALAAVLAVASLITLAALFAGALPIWPFAVLLASDVTLIWALRKPVAGVTEAVGTPARSLQTFSLLLARLEREQLASPRLKALRAELEIAGLPASQRIARLKRWMDWLDSGDHILVRAIRPLVLWKEQLAMGIEAWRSENGSYIARWLPAVAEFEALCSLSSLAFERPDWAMPVLLDNPAPSFEAEGLRHPLMVPSECISNEVALGADLHLLIVSGSNMSGKSTLLRAMGLNCVLAWAGAPVAARSLRISPLQTGASIRITDSLHDNRSRFFAEISRIRQIAELTKRTQPVLFLLDELLSGTNSHDRRIGAAGIVRGLVKSGAIGLITTHDLALAEIQQDLGAAAANVHFEDRIVDGRVEFDYRLRPGIVTHSNALELMRAVGLEV